MRKGTTLLILLAITVLIISCTKPITTGSISGNIYFSGTTMPVSGVTVDVGNKKSTTSSDGTYKISGIPIGAHTLMASKEGFDPYYQEIDIILDDTVTHDLSMTSQMYTSRIFGTVLGSLTNQPQSGLIICILNPDKSDSSLKTTTSSTGYFQLPSVPQGERTLELRNSELVLDEFTVFLTVGDYQFDIELLEPSSTFEFLDIRDDQYYSAIPIGNQIWMAENLRYLPKVSSPSSGSTREPFYYVYGYHGTNVDQAKDKPNYLKYGVLYNWEAAKRSCPEGWHLPTDGEWTELEDYLGIIRVNGFDRGRVAQKLKSTTGWENGNQENGNGDNRSGFNALPTGQRFYQFDGFFSNVGHDTFFWSSDISPDGIGEAGISIEAVIRMLTTQPRISSRGYNFSHAGPVRCIKD